MDYIPYGEPMMSPEPYLPDYAGFTNPNLESNLFQPYNSYSPLESTLMDSYSNPFPGSSVNPYGEIIGSNSIKIGEIDYYGGIRDPIWNSQMGVIDAYDNIRDIEDSGERIQ